MYRLKIKKKELPLFAIAIFVSTQLLMHPSFATDTVNATKPITNSLGMTAPFLMSWVPIWIFALAGGGCSLFIKLDKVDIYFRALYFAKPILGMFSSISLCLFVASGAEPPEVILIGYAFAMAFFSAPLLQGALVLLSSIKNQAAVINTVSPIKLEVPDQEDKKS